MISQQTKRATINLVKQGQNCKLNVYKDTEGYDTIGFGHKLKKGENLTQITQDQADKLLEKDLQIAIKTAQNTVGSEQFQKLSSQRQAVVIDMAFNMGQFKFPGFIKGIKQNNFDQAAYQILQSKYRTQTKIRSYRNALIFKDNKIYTKSQTEIKCLTNNLLSKDKKGALTYSVEVKDPRIKNILGSLNPIKSDAEMAKQYDKIKKVVGGVSFDIDPTITPLNGFISQNQAIKMIEGNPYDSSSYYFMDLVTPLKIMYDQNIKSKNISVSLDPFVPTEPDGPWYRKTFYPKQLENTKYGQDMIQADYLMKQLSLGVDQNNKPFPYPQRLKQMGLEIQSIFKSTQHYEGSRTRLWIVIKDYQIGVNEKFFQVKKIVMGVQLKALQISQTGTLRDCGSDPSPLAKKFCQIFTKNYDELSEIYPILGKMKRLAKASIIAKLMYLKRIPVDFQLIDRQFYKEKGQFEQKLPRLQNTLKKQNGGKIIQMNVLGGCSFDISNIQNKISELDKQVKQIRQIYELKKDTKDIQFKFSDKENIGQYFFVKNDKEEINNRQLYPFLFQSLVKCKNCQKICNLDFYSITNKQCIDHSSMKCKICQNLVLPSQKFKSNPDKSMIFHENCFKCSGCKLEIQGPFANYEGLNYHAACIPKKTVGTCDQCKKTVYHTQPHAQNPTTGAIYHGECAIIFNKRVQDSIPSCKQCKVKIQSKYVKYEGEIYHQECIKKKMNMK